MEILAILLAIAIGFSLFAVSIYNSLVALRNKAEESWSDIDTQLKRRFDLIPNIIETVKGYASHEKSTFENVTKARTMAMNASTVKEKESADNMLSGALKSLFAVSENYPDLKANQNFMQLQNTLKEIEEHIQLSRRYYNATVRDLNTKIETFPANIVANMFKFEKKDFFEIKDQAERENVKVDFSK
jgi:LemA protein